jgi:hypothetical protein
MQLLREPLHVHSPVYVCIDTTAYACNYLPTHRHYDDIPSILGVPVWCCVALNRMQQRTMTRNRGKILNVRHAWQYLSLPSKPIKRERLLLIINWMSGIHTDLNMHRSLPRGGQLSPLAANPHSSLYYRIHKNGKSNKICRPTRLSILYCPE